MDALIGAEYPYHSFGVCRTAFDALVAVGAKVTHTKSTLEAYVKVGGTEFFATALQVSL